MIRWILLLLCLSTATANAKECVVLLHGLARTAGSMEHMADALESNGYRTANVDYPSRDFSIKILAPLAVNTGLKACRAEKDLKRIHFVTHSLGGILVRYYLAENEVPELGRVVMLGPPNQGSLASDKFRNTPGFEWLNGPAGAELGKGKESVPLSLGPANFELGVIAGNRSIDPIVSAVLPNPDDGRVSVDDTKLEGMTDFIVVDHSHAFMMRMRKTIKRTLEFLENGRFD